MEITANVSVDPTTTADENSTTIVEARTIFDPPNSIKTFTSKQLLFLGCSICMVSLVWLAVNLTMYPTVKDYHGGVNMFEARWLPSTMFIAGVLCLALKWYKYETVFLGCAVASFYSCASSIVTITVYSINLNRSITMDHYPTNQNSSTRARYRYIQLCCCMIVTVFFGFVLLCLLLRSLHQVAIWYYKTVHIPRRTWLYLFVSGKIQICMLLFSIYVTSRIIALPFSYVHTYIIQELLCSLIMFAVSVLQLYVVFKSNNLFLKFLLVLSACQFFQEIFYAWNSYYISLYIHSNKIKLAVDVGYDQAIMTANFVTHFIRMCLSAYTAYVLVDIINLPFVDSICKLDLNRRVLQSIVAISATVLILASCHVILDIVYASAAHVYRNFIAFTGISVFYLILIGVNLSLFLRHRNTVLLINAALFLLLLTVVSFHSIFIYLNTTFKMVIALHYETMKRDFWQPTHLHLAETLLAFAAIIVCLLGGAIIFRILHIDSGNDRRYSTTIQRPLMIVFALGCILFVTTVIETGVVCAIKGDTTLVDSTLDYGILDLISMYVLSLLQIYATNPLNVNISFPLITLFLFLLCEVLTTYHYLSTYTIYVQTMIILSDLIGSRNTFMSLVTPFQVKILIANYAIQLVQWILTIVSLIICAVVIEMLQEQRVDLAKPLNGWSSTQMDNTTSQVRISSLNSQQPHISVIKTRKEITTDNPKTTTESKRDESDKIEILAAE